MLKISLYLVEMSAGRKCQCLLARTGTLTVALLAGDIGQSGLVPGRETMFLICKEKGKQGSVHSQFRAKRGAPLPTRYGDFIPLGRPAGGGSGGLRKSFRKSFPKMGFGINIIA